MWQFFKTPKGWLALTLVVALKLLAYSWLLLNYPVIFAVYVAIKLVLKISILGAAVLWVKEKMQKRLKSKAIKTGKRF